MFDNPATATLEKKDMSVKGLVAVGIINPVVLKVAVVGCGQIFQSLHLPSLLCQKNIRINWLIDKNPDNIRKVSKSYPKADKGEDVENISDVDAVIIATPNGLHYRHVRCALEHGWHVLVEKPLATRIEDAEQLVAVAAEKNLNLCVNLNRRFLPNIPELKALIRSGEFGAVRKIEVVDGGRSTGLADSAVTYHSSLELAGGGVLLGTGSHMIDLVDYLIGLRSIDKVDYADDGFTGLEAECRFSFKAQTDGGSVEVNGFFSYISQSTKRVTVHFDRAIATADLNRVDSLQVTGLNDSKIILDIPVQTVSNPIQQSFASSIEEFIMGCRSRDYKPLNSAYTCLPSLKIITQCYSQRKTLPNPWNETYDTRSLKPGGAKKAKQCVGIIGAGGFLGSRLFERLIRSDSYYPRAITHSSMGSLSVLRYTDSIHTGDASDETFLGKALAGCDVVVNCAINTRGPRRFAIKATRGIAGTAAKVAAKVGVNRLVHISTVAVHGIFLGRTTDHLQLDPARSTYALAKYYSEQDVLKQCRQSGQELVILRMGHIYGPYSSGWTASQRDLVCCGDLVSVENWQNPSNTVFVDNAVDAIIAAINGSNVDGQMFYVTDWPNKSWREFYGPLFEVEGKNIESVRNVSFDEFSLLFRANNPDILSQMSGLIGDILRPCVSKEHLKAIKAARKYQRLMNLIENAMPIGLFNRIKSSLKNSSPAVEGIEAIRGDIFDLMCSYASNIALPVDRALTQLGYRPSVNQDKAFEITTAWLRAVE